MEIMSGRYIDNVSPSGERVEEDDRYIDGNLEQGVWWAWTTGLASFSAHLHQYIPTFGYTR